MKMKNLIIFSFITAAFLVSCNKADIIDNAQQVGISKITYYPILTVTGPAYATVAKGSAFTDPGATAVAGGANVPVTTSGTVNTNSAGVYIVTYTATNKDGFSASASRFVVVYSTDAGAAAQDFSGNYARTSNGSIATWTKIAPGVYQVFNPGGAPGTNLTVIAFNPTGLIIHVPPQTDSAGGTTSCTNATGGADITYILGPPDKYAWKVVNVGYGTSVRTFIKQ
jgi:hypothetical protein